MDRFAVAELAKEKGNVAFKVNDYVTARSLYSHAMTIDQSNHLYPLNRSMANLKLANWDEAEADATKTLNMSPMNLKALFRRALSRKELGQWDQARKDIQVCIDHGGDSREGAQELKAISAAEILPPSLPTLISTNANNTFANLCLDNDSHSFTIQHSTIVQTGHGVFATREFQRGDLILSEKPIFSVPTYSSNCSVGRIEREVRNLSPCDLDGFLSLHNSHAECSCFPNPLVEIYGTNSFSLTHNELGGICLKASKFNHSCSPNARNSFNANTGELRIYALGTIPVGEEIFIAYLTGRQNLYGSPRQRRLDILRSRYHFTCACSVCSLSDIESKKSDARRIKLNQLWEIIPSFSPMQGLQRLTVIVEAVLLLKEEGFLADADDFTNDAGVVCAYHSDWVSAKYWTNLTYQTRVAEFGKDSPRAEEVRGAYLNPKALPMAGCGLPKNFTDIRVESNV